jgi:hypothetical protein
MDGDNNEHWCGGDGDRLIYEFMLAVADVMDAQPAVIVGPPNVPDSAAVYNNAIFWPTLPLEY